MNNIIFICILNYFKQQFTYLFQLTNFAQKFDMQSKNLLVTFFIAFLLSLVIFFSCNKNNQDQNHGYIPNVPVNMYIQPENEGLIAGTWRVYPYEGYRGIFIYRLDQFTFLAFEQACPYDANLETAYVQINPASFQLIDSTCLSSYNLLDGMPVSGPASLPLLQYLTEFDGINLHVFNPQ